MNIFNIIGLFMFCAFLVADMAVCLIFRQYKDILDSNKELREEGYGLFRRFTMMGALSLILLLF